MTNNRTYGTPYARPIRKHIIDALAELKPLIDGFGKALIAEYPVYCHIYAWEYIKGANTSNAAKTLKQAQAGKTEGIFMYLTGWPTGEMLARIGTCVGAEKNGWLYLCPIGTTKWMVRITAEDKRGDLGEWNRQLRTSSSNGSEKSSTRKRKAASSSKTKNVSPTSTTDHPSSTTTPPEESTSTSATGEDSASTGQADGEDHSSITSSPTGPSTESTASTSPAKRSRRSSASTTPSTASSPTTSESTIRSTPGTCEDQQSDAVLTTATYIPGQTNRTRHGERVQTTTRPGTIPPGSERRPIPIKEDQPSGVIVTPIPEDILTILRQADTRGNMLILPRIENKKTYAAVDKVLGELGGKWSRSAKAHVFEPSDLAMAVAAFTAGAYISPRENCYFPTPQPLVVRMIQKAELGFDMTILEPSAGQGAIADLAAKVVGEENITCCEVIPRNQIVLLEKGYQVWGFDFLQAQPWPEFDRVLMNPPFRQGIEIDHVLHAMEFITPGGMLVAIMPQGCLTAQTKKAIRLRDAIKEGQGTIDALPDGSFKESDTNIQTVLISWRKADDA